VLREKRSNNFINKEEREQWGIEEDGSVIGDVDH
jgi:hypothetical protein